MKASIALSAAMLASITACAMAQQSAYKSGDAQLDALIADISGGRRDAAIARISSIESMSGKRTLATTPSQFVDRLLGCRPDGTAKDIGFDKTKLIQIVWACPSARYYTVFDPDYAKPYITVGEFEDEAVRKTRLAQRAAPPAPAPPSFAPRTATPPMTGAESAALLRTTFSMLLTGNFSQAPALVAPDARITFGRRDPAAKVTVVELDGTGPDAFVEQSRRAIAKLGTPVSADCDNFSCRFTYVKRDRILIILAGVRGGKLISAQFLYAFRGSAT